MNLRAIYGIALTAALTACSHSEIIREQQAADYCVEKFSYDQKAQLSQCINQRKAALAQQDRAMSAALMAVGFGMMAASAPPPPQPSPPQDRVCIAPNNALYRC